MKKVVFLDRDGVINREIGDYVFSLKNFKLNDGLSQALLYWKNLVFHLQLLQIKVEYQNYSTLKRMYIF